MDKPAALGEMDCVELLRKIDMAIVGVDALQEKVIFVNDFARSILGFVQPFDFPTVQRYFLSPVQLPLQGKIIQKDLAHRDRIYGYSIYPVGAGGFLWLFISDITEKSRLHSLADSMNLMNNIGYIFMGLAHELGNPLNSIKMTLNVLADNFAEFPENTRREYLGSILGEIGRMEYLLKSIKSFNAFEELQMRGVVLADFLDDIARLYRSEMQQKGITLQVRNYVGRVQAQADPRALNQVLLNLISNSIEALVKRENPQIIISLLRLHKRLHIRLHDNGCGISEEQIKYMFLPFNTTKSKGTGLGLAIVKKLLTQMGGWVEIKSTVNLETIVDISLVEWRDGQA